MVLALDQAIGNLTATFKEEGLYNNSVRAEHSWIVIVYRLCLPSRVAFGRGLKGGYTCTLVRARVTLRVCLLMLGYFYAYAFYVFAFY